MTGPNLTLQAADLLDQAADDITKFGWAQKRFTPKGSTLPLFVRPRCADAAIWLAAECDPDERTAKNRIAREAEVIFAEWLIDQGTPECTFDNGDRDEVETIAGFNDRMDAEAVAEALRICAARARTYPSVTRDDNVWHASIEQYTDASLAALVEAVDAHTAARNTARTEMKGAA